MKVAILVFITLLAFSHAAYAQSNQSLCPNIAVNGPAGITNPGDEIHFSLVIDRDVDLSKLEVEWTVEGGEIVDGQGSSSIRAKSGPRNEAVVATVIIRGLAANCKNEASEIAPVSIIGCVFPSDVYGDLPLWDELARFDTFFAELQNNLTNKGYVLKQIGPIGDIEKTKQRIRRIVRHADYRKFDKRRLTFVISREEGSPTQLWRIPEDGEAPECTVCEVIHGDSM